LQDPRLFRRAQFLIAGTALSISACAGGAKSLLPGSTSGASLSSRGKNAPRDATATPTPTAESDGISIIYGNGESSVVCNGQTIFENTFANNVVTMESLGGSESFFPAETYSFTVTGTAMATPTPTPTPVPTVKPTVDPTIKPCDEEAGRDISCPLDAAPKLQSSSESGVWQMIGRTNNGRGMRFQGPNGTLAISPRRDRTGIAALFIGAGGAAFRLKLNTKGGISTTLFGVPHLKKPLTVSAKLGRFQTNSRGSQTITLGPGKKSKGVRHVGALHANKAVEGGVVRKAAEGSGYRAAATQTSVASAVSVTSVSSATSSPNPCPSVENGLKVIGCVTAHASQGSVASTPTPPPTAAPTPVPAPTATPNFDQCVLTALTGSGLWAFISKAIGTEVSIQEFVAGLGVGDLIPVVDIPVAVLQLGAEIVAVCYGIVSLLTAGDLIEAFIQQLEQCLGVPVTPFNL